MAFVSEFLDKKVRREVFVQIGTNYGSDAFRDMVRRYEPRIVILIEPNPDLIPYIRENYAGILGVYIENVAITDKDEDDVVLYIPADNKEYCQANFSLVPRNDWGLKGEMIEIHARGVTLASILAKYNLKHVDYLCIDTEGFDTEILKGLDYWNNQIDIIDFEYWAYHPEEFARHNIHWERLGYAGYETIVGMFKSLNYDFCQDSEDPMNRIATTTRLETWRNDATDKRSVSIVMTYWNRKKQLEKTLQSIARWSQDVEIIIVDDASTDGDDILCFEKDNIKVITLKDKTWINPCIAWNTGFMAATGKVVIMQSAECMHVGDIVTHARYGLNVGTYFAYSALAINEETTGRILNGDNVNETIKPFLENRIDVPDWDGNGWYNHPIYRPSRYNFCCAITRYDLDRLGGFDERFADGLGYDDDELLNRIDKAAIGVKIIEHPFVVHQHHSHFTPGNVPDLMTINSAKWEITKQTESWDVKPFNAIYK